ncbi:SusC/RagA family TonB-linked outer membrane protein [Maribacter ulvicola]|uniref:TonB-linked outer membrane protein, SusC/RagA family n=1 Tax=Maribacter ulvicola TaxID=228959 RepID=A0A1N6XBJ5_9FLAO|nr:TonB-dependent receptor [Maribacter ulvicola]SIQ99601.1 TonB-linked outer membrane protein, SusC/RagA family [Maribacter ulvicola]
MKRKNKFLNGVLTLAAILLFSGVHGQEKIITGTITDDSNQPLPGANVLVKNTANGVQSDFDGNFSISATSADVLVFSYIGFSKKEITVGSQSVINIILKEDASQLDEVVVVGYGSQSRETLTSSISKLDTKVLENVPFANATQALQGSIAGIRAQQTSGQPGAGTRIIIRGGTSINNPDGAGPLYIIDGIIRDNMDDLNSADIASVQVLKDAAAASIYGSRASNGVIIVTTKTGKGKPKISYNVTTGMSQIGKTYDLVSARDYIYYGRLGIAATGEKHPERLSRLDLPVGAGIGNDLTNNTSFTTQYLQPGVNDHKLNEGWESMPDPLDSNKTIIFKGTDWQDKLFKTGLTTNHHLSFSGSTEDAEYDVSVGYLKSEGVALKTDYERYTAKMYGGFNIRDNFKVWGRVNYSTANNNQVFSSNQIFQRSLGLPPTAKFAFEDGTLAPGQNRGIGNPVYHLGRFDKERRDYRLSLSIGLDYQIFSDLTFSPFFSYSQEQDLDNAFQKSYFNTATSFNDSRNASADFEQDITTQIEGVFTYAKIMKDEHALNAKAGFSRVSREAYILGADGRGASSDLIPTLNASAEPTNVTSSFSSRNIIGFFGRVNYDYKRKYLLTASIRHDGASNLGADFKWGTFPGVSAGWNVHKEGFWGESTSTFSSLKFRASYGVTGNIGELEDYKYQGVYGVGNKYNRKAAVLNSSLSNDALQWEQTEAIGAGFDLGLFNNRVTLLFDYYNRDTHNLITSFTLPKVTGFSSILTNLGDLNNEGVELELNARIIENDNFGWVSALNLSHNKNTISKLPENGNDNNRIGGYEVADPVNGGTRWVAGLQEGQTMGDLYTYEVLGVYATTAEAEAGPIDELVAGSDKRKQGGDIIFRDVNNDGVINTLDRVYVGNEFPDWTGGFTNTFNYKNLSLTVRTDFSIGHTIVNQMHGVYLGQWQGDIGITKEVLRSWENEGDVTDIPRYYWADQLAQNNNFRTGGGQNIAMNSDFYEKGDYLALREITLSYNLPLTPGVAKLGISNLRLYATGSNLGYITNYRGLLPEDGGIDNGRYPNPQTFLLGLNVSL